MSLKNKGRPISVFEAKTSLKAVIVIKNKRV
jgi:hypothetical protein